MTLKIGSLQTATTVKIVMSYSTCREIYYSFRIFNQKLKVTWSIHNTHGSATGLSKFYNDLMVDGNESQFYGA